MAMLNKNNINRVFKKRKQKMINVVMPLIDQNIPVIATTFNRDEMAFLYNLLMYKVLHGYCKGFECYNVEEYELEALRIHDNLTRTKTYMQSGRRVKWNKPLPMLRDQTNSNRPERAEAEQITQFCCGSCGADITGEEFCGCGASPHDVINPYNKDGRIPPSDTIRNELKQVEPALRQQLLKQLLLEQAEDEAYERELLNKAAEQNMIAEQEASQ